MLARPEHLSEPLYGDSHSLTLPLPFPPLPLPPTATDRSKLAPALSSHSGLLLPRKPREHGNDKSILQKRKG